MVPDHLYLHVQLSQEQLDASLHHGACFLFTRPQTLYLLYTPTWIEQSLRFSYHANIIPHAGKAPDVISEGSRTKVTSEKDSCRSFVQRRDLIAMATNKQIELSWSYSEY